MGVNGAGLPGKFTDAEKNESTSFLPGDAESTKALQAVEELQGGEKAAAVVVYRRDGGLTAADRQVIAEDRRNFNADLPRATQPLSRARPVARRHDGAGRARSSPATARATRSSTRSTSCARRSPTPAAACRPRSPARPASRPTRSRSSRASTARSLLAAVSLVILLLIVIYRSPIFWLIPLFAVVFAEISVQRARLRADRARRHRQRPVLVDPLRARARRGDRLRAAAGVALPRGAAPARGQARGARAGAAHRRAGDRRLRHDGDRRAAGAVARRGQRHRGPRARSARWASPWRCSRC